MRAAKFMTKAAITTALAATGAAYADNNSSDVPYKDAPMPLESSTNTSNDAMPIESKHIVKTYADPEGKYTLAVITKSDNKVALLGNESYFAFGYAREITRNQLIDCTTGETKITSNTRIIDLPTVGESTVTPQTAIRPLSALTPSEVAKLKATCTSVGLYPQFGTAAKTAPAPN